TTLATNLAVALAQESSASVALVDLDVPFGDIALLLDIHPEQDILDALDEAVLDDLERLQNLLVHTIHGVHVLSSPLAPDYAATQSAALGRPVVQSQPKSRLARDIQGIARQLAGAPTAARSSWLPWRRRSALITAMSKSS